MDTGGPHALRLDAHDREGKADEESFWVRFPGDPQCYAVLRYVILYYTNAILYYTYSGSKAKCCTKKCHTRNHFGSDSLGIPYGPKSFTPRK